ncbi:GNAT family N-acetyltransferase [Burkholderiaceae bacterium DAT-1]|nr:GNAT family N-acetyltransferase [Burkholderiaceae bacterium DAT-1]
MYRIEAIAPVHLPGFRLTLDQVAREDRYFRIDRAPSLYRLCSDVDTSLAQGGVHRVATVQNEVVGWCDIRPLDAGDCAELRMGVDARYRNQGMGSELMQSALDAAWQQGIRQITLEIYNGSEAAARFCERAGFRRVTPEGVAPSAKDGHGQTIVMALSRPVQ